MIAIPKKPSRKFIFALITALLFALPGAQAAKTAKGMQKTKTVSVADAKMAMRKADEDQQKTHAQCTKTSQDCSNQDRTRHQRDDDAQRRDAKSLR